jgi:hypothetical protein
VTVVVDYEGVQWPLRGVVTTLGRDPDCDIVLDTKRVGRRQASLWDEGRGGLRLVVHGMASMVFVDGALVVCERRVRVGSQISIGDATLVVRERQGDAATTGFFIPPQDPHERPVVAGRVTTIVDTLTMLVQAGATGRIVFEGGANDGDTVVWIGGGRILHAESDRGDGVEVVYNLAYRKAERFAFYVGTGDPPLVSITQPGAFVIMELARQMDDATSTNGMP